MPVVAGVRFKRAGKIYYFDPGGLTLQNTDKVIVETARGLEYGEVVIAPREVAENNLVLPLKTVMRTGTEDDARRVEENQLKQKEAFAICTEKISDHDLPMKLIDVEYTFDNSKIIFYFTAEGRVDFRELVKNLAAIFRTRIELRQIGVRDEAKMVGGIGGCGRVLCCHAFLGDFEPVSIRMAKDQNLSLNPTKISGICGRLMCCLKYENEVYENMKNPQCGRACLEAAGAQGPGPCPAATEGAILNGVSSADNLSADGEATVTDPNLAGEYLESHGEPSKEPNEELSGEPSVKPNEEQNEEPGAKPSGEKPVKDGEPMDPGPAVKAELAKDSQSPKPPERTEGINPHQQHQPRNGKDHPAGAGPAKRSDSHKHSWPSSRNRNAENRPPLNQNGTRPELGKAKEPRPKSEDSRGNCPAKPSGMPKTHDPFKGNQGRRPKDQAKLSPAGNREGQKSKAGNAAEGRSVSGRGKPDSKKNVSRNQGSANQFPRKPQLNRLEGIPAGLDKSGTGAEKTLDPRPDSALKPGKAERARVMTVKARKNKVQSTGGQGGAHFPGDLGD